MKHLTKEDTDYIVESLLFGLCLEITDRWTEEDRFKMLNLAKKLQTEDTSLNNIDLHLFVDSEDILTKEVYNNFKINTIKVNALTDIID